MGAPLVAFSDEMAKNDRALKDFLSRNMYRHYKVNRMASKARRVVSDLFQLYMAEPECLPPEWCRRMENRDQAGAARQIADFIAGMTDRTALVEHERLFDLTTISL
jgi:dGTPase